MMKIQTFAVVALSVVFALAAGACGSKGEFTPYTVGSQLKKGDPIDAKLELNCTGDNCMAGKPEYSVTLSFPDSYHPSVTLGSITNGKFTTPGPDKVSVATGKKYGMSITTADVLLEGLIDHATLTLSYIPDVRSGKYSQKIDYNYLIQITLYDDEERTVGEFREVVTEKTDSSMLGVSRKQPYSLNPTAPSSIFRWAATRANQR